MSVAMRKMCQIGGFLLLTIMCFLVLSVISYSPSDPSWHYRISGDNHAVRNLGGVVGASLADSGLQTLGSAVWLFIVIGGLAAWHLMQVRLAAAATVAWRGGLLVVAVSTGLHLCVAADPLFGAEVLTGGWLGDELAEFLMGHVNRFGSYLVVSASVILALFIGTDFRHRCLAVWHGCGVIGGYVRRLGWYMIRGVCNLAGAIRWIFATVARWGMAAGHLVRRCLPAATPLDPAHREDALSSFPEIDEKEEAIEAASIFSTAQDGSDAEPYASPLEQAIASDVVASDVAERAETTSFRASSRPSRSGKRRVSMPLPALTLLDPSSSAHRDQSPEEQQAQARFLEKKLRDFGVEGEVVQVLPGPVITMYEFAPAPGVKVNKIVNLQDDLALVMRALSVRVVAPIPGKAVVGIEIPNRRRETVGLRELLDSEEFRTSSSKLILALGQDILGRPVVTDLALIPHLLIAGATGSGKSVGLNSMICSLLFRVTPAEVRMIMIDPKMLELSIYDGIPHLLIPVVTHPKQAAVALRRVVEEMERRYQLLASRGVRSIAQYNQAIEAEQATYLDASGGDRPGQETGVVPEEKLPYLVVVIDELSDLMMVSSREVEDSLTRIAQMARAAGIHLIVATQRPSVDVLTGIIKANFPARMSFQVSSKTDSRTILDVNGAEKLLGRGDMLFLAPGTSKPQRIHGAYVSEQEIKRLVTAWRDFDQPQYDDAFLKPSEEALDVEDAEYDEKYDEAVALVAHSGQASISGLQRRLRVGYNRAARMIEMMEREGIIGPADGVRPREVLVRKDYDDM